MNKECPACETRHRDDEQCPPSRDELAEIYVAAVNDTRKRMQYEIDDLKKELEFIKAARAKCQKTICEDCGSLLQRF